MFFNRLIDKKPGDYAPPDHSNEPTSVIHWTLFEACPPHILISDFLCSSHLIIMQALGGLAYIYVCNDLSFNIIGSLKRPTLKKYRWVIGISMGGTVLACGLMGISGYTHYLCLNALLLFLPHIIFLVHSLILILFS